MPNSIDNKVVEMTFNNGRFQKNVADTMSSLDKLKASLNFGNVKSGFSDIQAEASKVDLSKLGNDAEGASSKFKALAVAATASLAAVGVGAAVAGAKVAKSFILDPAIDGFREYETNMNSIQTILANTFSDNTTLTDVNKSLDELNHYSDQTIYNFSEMARNIGTFTAAGVDLKTSTESIKGIANLAALSGSSSEQASTAMYQLSQAMASGTVKLMDWNSVVNAGMGGENFQKALFESGKAMNTLKDVPMTQTFEQWKDAGNTFRDSLQDGWITGDVLTNTLKTMTGDMSEAQIVAMGYSKEQAKQLYQLGQVGMAAAQEIKTGSQLVSVIKESIGSGWATTFRTIVGDFKEAKGLFTGIGTFITGVVGKSADARNKMLQDWKNFGGRTVLLEGLFDVLKALKSVIDPIRFAFRTVFPKKTAGDLLILTVAFRNFAEKLAINTPMIKILANVFGFLFSALKMGVTIVKTIGSVISGFISGVASGGGGALIGFISALVSGVLGLVRAVAGGLLGDRLGGIGDASKSLGEKLGGLIAKIQPVTDKINKFFLELNNGEIVKSIGDTIGGLASKFKTAAVFVKDFFGLLRGDKSSTLNLMNMSVGMAEFVKRIKDIKKDIKKAFGSLDGFKEVGGNIISGLVSGIQDGASKVKDSVMKLAHKVIEAIKGPLKIHSPSQVFMEIGGNIIDGLIEGLKNGWTAIKNFFSDVGGKIGDALGSDGFKNLIAGGLVGVLASLALSIKRLTKDGFGINFFVKFSDQLENTFGQLGDTLKAFELKVKSEALRNIAIAVAILAASMLVLAFIPADKLKQGLGAVTAALVQITASMKIISGSDWKKTAAAGIGLLAISAGLLIVAFAVKKFASMDFEGMKKGFLAVTGVLALFIITSRLLGKESTGMIETGFAMIGLSLALLIMTYALKGMAELDVKKTATSLGALAAALLILTGSLRLMGDKDTAKKGLAVLLLVISLKSLAQTVQLFANMPWEELKIGMGAVAVGLGLMVAALKLMPDNAEKLGLGLLLVAASLIVMAKAVELMGSLDLETMQNGLKGIAAILIMLSIAMLVMEEASVGAIAMAGAAASLIVMAVALKMFNDIKWDSILKGLAALAGVLVILGIAAYAINIMVLVLMALGYALLLMGAGFLLFGAGALLAAYAITELAKAGESGFQAFMRVLDIIIGAIPHFIAVFAKSVIDGMKATLKQLPELMKIFGTVLDALFNLIIKMAPKLFKMIGVLIDGLFDMLTSNNKRFIELGVTMLTNLLLGLADNSDSIAGAVLTMIQKFLDAVTEKIPDILDSGVKLLTTFLEGLAGKANEISEAIGVLIISLIAAIVGKWTDIRTAGTDALVEFLGGLSEDIDKITKAVGKLITNFINGVAEEAIRIGAAGAKALADFLDGMADNINTVCPAAGRVIHALVGCLGHLISELIPGKGIAVIGEFVGGIGGRIGDVVSKGTEIITKVVSGIYGAMSRIAHQGANVIGSFFQGIGGRVGEVAGQGLKIAEAIIEGLADGIRAGFNKVKAAAEELASRLPGWVKTILGIKSPSRVMQEVGNHVVEGFAIGLSDHGTVRNAATKMSQAVMDAMSTIPDSLAGMDEFNPTITPVLDLSRVAGEAGKLNGLMGVPTVSPESSYIQAQHLAHTNDDTAATPQPVPTGPSEVKFEQNIYAPKALSTGDIYRGTKSQIALAKEEFKI